MAPLTLSAPVTVSLERPPHGMSLSIDNASVLAFSLVIDGFACTQNLDPAWIGQKDRYTFLYDSGGGGTAEMLRNGSQISACGGAGGLPAGAIGVNSQDLLLGDSSLSGALVFDLQVWEGSSKALHYGFDATAVEETSGTNPFTGTVEDHSGNGLDGVYTFDRDQAGLTVTAGSFQLVSAGLSNPFTESSPDVAGSPLGADFFAAQGENTDAPLYDFLSGAVTGLRLPRMAAWQIVFLPASFLLMVVAWLAVKFVPLAIFAAGLPYAAGVTVYRVVPEWWLLMWVLLMVVSYGAQQWYQRA